MLLFVHGGGFVGGDKHVPGTPFHDNIGAWAARHGMVGVTMTYRLAPQAPWPAGAEDVAAAVRWVRAHIGEYGGDPARLFLMGHSAGATHVSTYVAHPAIHGADGPGPAGLILSSGIYDLGDFPLTDKRYRSYFGEDESLYAERSALPGLAQQHAADAADARRARSAALRAAGRGVARRVERAGRAPRFLRLPATIICRAATRSAPRTRR